MYVHLRRAHEAGGSLRDPRLMREVVGDVETD